MKLEHIEILKKMKSEGVERDLAEKVFLEYQKEEKKFWFQQSNQRITSLYIESMRDIMSSRNKSAKQNKNHKRNIELEVQYDIGDIFNMNFYLNYKDDSNFFHPAMIIHKNDKYVYVSIGSSAIDPKNAYHYKYNKIEDKNLFLIKSFETKFKDVSLDSNTVFILKNIQAINVSRLERSKFIGTIKQREEMVSLLKEYYKNFF